MSFGCLKEPSHRDGSFEYPQHMFLLRNKKNNFQPRTLIGGYGYLVRPNLSGIPSEFQRVCTTIMSKILSGLILGKLVCKGVQQTAIGKNICNYILIKKGKKVALEGL